jgi:transcriptional regulator with XRE-family HTH domain
MENEKRNIKAGQRRGGSRRGMNEKNLRRKLLRLEMESAAWDAYLSGLTVSEIARKLGRDKSRVSRWMSDRAQRLAGGATEAEMAESRLRAAAMLSRAFEKAFDGPGMSLAKMEICIRLASRIAIVSGVIRPEAVASVDRSFHELRRKVVPSGK